MNAVNDEASPEYRPRPKGDSFGGYTETTQMKKLIKWKPKTQLKTASKDTTTGSVSTIMLYPNGYNRCVPAGQRRKELKSEFTKMNTCMIK